MLSVAIFREDTFEKIENSWNTWKYFRWDRRIRELDDVNHGPLKGKVVIEKNSSET